MPQGARPAGQQNEGLNSVVYAVENGDCHPSKTLTYDEVFPGLGSSDTKTFWVKTTSALESGSQNSFRADVGSTPVTNYVFTNPPADKLQGKQVSFCVRFHSPASVTSTTTVITTAGSVATQESTQKPVATQQNPQQTGTEDKPTPSAKVEVHQPSLEDLVKKDSPREGHKLVEDKEEPVNLLEKDGDKKIVHKMPGVYLSKQSADHEGETPVGFDLTVIIHSSASHVTVHTLSIFSVLASSLLGILQGAPSV
ncbi:toxoplasma gondii family a protein [Cystoisospora suis]|uniref:Toxoplasma gondii family a protein n=1 Tax=Cystoisospora suis TaxID=483139 RepID=A0A2C6KFX9_9APIC|nr:toxoplasma gondii family a protein [Cystoisospora suis]